MGETCLAASLICFVVFALLFYLSSELEIASWLPALFLALSVFILHAYLKSEWTARWDKRYIWMCHGSDIKEELFLTSGSSPVESHGRINKVKTYVLEQSKATIAQCKYEMNFVREDLQDCRQEVS